MLLLNELLERAMAALMSPAALREASVSKATYSLVGAFRHDPLGAWHLSLFRNGCNHLAKFLTSDTRVSSTPPLTSSNFTHKFNVLNGGLAPSQPNLFCDLRTSCSLGGCWSSRDG